MVVPDFEMICENFLISEGFMEARTLAKKFISLYSLCKELLSKQDHYDWGLRAIKSVLCVAGKLRVMTKSGVRSVHKSAHRKILKTPTHKHTHTFNGHVSLLQSYFHVLQTCYF